MLKHGNSYYELYYHVVFSTKRRMQVLDKNKIKRINKIARAKAEEIGFLIHILNGYKDHIHILLTIPPSLAVAKVIKDIKGTSSRAIPELTWQEGYYVKSLKKKDLEAIFEYIENQWIQHQK